MIPVLIMLLPSVITLQIPVVNTGMLDQSFFSLSKKLICKSLELDSCQLLGAARLEFLVVRTQQRDLVSGSSDRFKNSMVTTAAPERWSLAARARRLPGYHRQSQAGSGILAAAMIVRLSMDLDVIFIMLGVLCTSGESL